MRPYHLPCGPGTSIDELLNAVDVFAEGELQKIQTSMLLLGADIDDIDRFLREQRAERVHIRARVRAQILECLAEANERARVEKLRLQ